LNAPKDLSITKPRGAFHYTRPFIMVLHRDMVGNLVSSSVLIPKLINLMNLVAYGKKFSMLVPH